MMRLCIGLVCLLGLSATAVAESPDAHADQDAVIKRLSEGLKLLSEGKDDAWISGFCSKAELCRNDRTISSLKQYNLPAAHGTARN